MTVVWDVVPFSRAEVDVSEMLTTSIIREVMEAVSTSKTYQFL
jgi:hypothetical protein